MPRPNHDLQKVCLIFRVGQSIGRQMLATGGLLARTAADREQGRTTEDMIRAVLRLPAGCSLMYERILFAEEVADLMRINPQTVRRFASEGLLVAVKATSSPRTVWRFPEYHIRQLIGQEEGRLKRLLTLKEAAEILGITPYAVFIALGKRRITAIRLPTTGVVQQGDPRFSESYIRELAAERAQR